MDLFCNFSILSWNIRGAMGKTTRRHVRDIVSNHHPSLCFILETHGPFSKVKNQWKSLGYNLVFIEEARGHSSGIWVLSCVDNIMFTLVSSNIQAINFAIRKGNVNWFCSAVYASPTPPLHGDLWVHLNSLRSTINGPWFLLGDFNEVLSASEVSGGFFSPSRADAMASMLSYCGLVDLDTIGGLYT